MASERCPACDDATVCGHEFHELVSQAELTQKVAEAVGETAGIAANKFSEFWTALTNLEGSVKYLGPSAKVLEKELKSIPTEAADWAVKVRELKARLSEHNEMCHYCNESTRISCDRGAAIYRELASAEKSLAAVLAKREKQ